MRRSLSTSRLAVCLCLAPTPACSDLIGADFDGLRLREPGPLGAGGEGGAGGAQSREGGPDGAPGEVLPPNLEHWGITPDLSGLTLAGLSVAIEGDLALVGVRDAASSGELLVARRMAGLLWAFTGERLDAGSHRASDANFGGSVALSGGWAVVGAPGVGSRPGEAHFFERVGDAFVHRGRFQALDPLNGDRFGWSVAIDGDVAAVGAPRREVDSPVTPGALQVFRRSGAGGFEPAETLTAPGAGTELDLFGVEVALLGDTLAVAATLHDAAGLDVGAVFVAEPAAGAFEIVQTLTPELPGPRTYRFGEGRLGLGEGLLLVPAGGTELHAFVRSDGRWREEPFPRPPGHEVGLGFGWRTAVHGDRAVVAFRSSPPRPEAGKALQGSALLYRRSGAAFQLERELWPGAGNSGQFGWTLDFDGATVAISDIYFRDHDGEVYFFPIPP